MILLAEIYYGTLCQYTLSTSSQVGYVIAEIKKSTDLLYSTVDRRMCLPEEGVRDHEEYCTRMFRAPDNNWNPLITGSDLG